MGAGRTVARDFCREERVPLPYCMSNLLLFPCAKRRRRGCRVVCGDFHFLARSTCLRHTIAKRKTIDLCVHVFLTRKYPCQGLPLTLSPGQAFGRGEFPLLLKRAACLRQGVEELLCTYQTNEENPNTRIHTRIKRHKIQTQVHPKEKEEHTNTLLTSSFMGGRRKSAVRRNMCTSQEQKKARAHVGEGKRQNEENNNNTKS